MKNYKFNIETLGCKTNQYESQVLREAFLRFGFFEAAAKECDLLIVNSCTVTEQADVKTRKFIRRIKRENPDVKIFVTGCYAVCEDDVEIISSMPEVETVIAGESKMDVPAMILSAIEESAEDVRIPEQISEFGSHTRAFVKVQDGCDQRCSYCKVTIVRGPSRSRDIEAIKEEVIRLVSGGYKELVLTGICIGSWRDDSGKRFPELIRAVIDIEKDFRIRISSIEPNHIDEQLIEIMANSTKLCDYLHIPLQSGSDKILKMMNRRYTSDVFRKKISDIRKSIPSIGLTMDIIAGFPGEDEADHKATLELIKEVRPSRLHVFKYSDRKGTISFENKNKVPPEVIKKRVKDLIEEGKIFQQKFAETFLGKDIEVLAENRTGDGYLYGYSSEYVRAKLKGFDKNEGERLQVKPNKLISDKEIVLYAESVEK